MFSETLESRDWRSRWMSAPVRASAAGAGIVSVDGSVAGSRGFWRAIIGLPNVVYKANYRSRYPGAGKGLLSLLAGLFLAPVAGLAHLLVARLGEVLLGISGGAAGDDNDLGATAVSAVAREFVHVYPLEALAVRRPLRLMTRSVNPWSVAPSEVATVSASP